MRLYLELARRGYRRYAAYPSAMVAGLFTNVVFGFLIAYILLAVYDETVSIGGYDVEDAIAYVWITQGLLSVAGLFGPGWWELARRVQTGDVATDLQRPLDLQHAGFAEDAGRALYQLVWRAVPQFLLGLLLFEITVPDEVARWFLFGISVALAVAVSFGIRFLVNLCSFWLLDYRGPVIIAIGVNLVLSGAVIPLAFFPEPLDTIMRLTPFAAVVQAPVDVYVGEPLGGSVALVLALQVTWAVLLYAVGRLVLGEGTRKLVLQVVELFRIYRLLVGARVRAQLEYRFSAALQLVGVTLLTAIDFVAIAVIFANVPQLGEWTVAEVALLYALATIAFALTDLAIGHLDLFPQMIREGTFDQILVRPLPSLLQIIASDFAIRRVGKILQGVAVLTYALVALDVDWTVGRVVAIPLAIAAGALIYGAVWVALATITFWIIDAIEVVNAFTYGGSFLSQYPIGIFARWLRGLVVFVVPLAFVAYFPALYVLDREDTLGLPEAFQYASPVVAVLAVLVSAAVWRNAVRHYRSAGG